MANWLLKGLCAGLAVSTFSRSLALILGLLVVGVQVCVSHPSIQASIISSREQAAGKRKNRPRTDWNSTPQITASISSRTTAYRNTSPASTYAQQCKTT